MEYSAELSLDWNPKIESLDDYRKRKAEEWERFFEALDYMSRIVCDNRE